MKTITGLSTIVSVQSTDAMTARKSGKTGTFLATDAGYMVFAVGDGPKILLRRIVDTGQCGSGLACLTSTVLVYIHNCT